jgi:hypothetical protein
MDFLNFADNLSLRRLKGQKVSKSMLFPGVPALPGGTAAAGIAWVNAGAGFIN